MNVQCEVCGNHYEHGFAIQVDDGESHQFDCFECAIHGMAPHCDHCGCLIIGHGVDDENRMYCCEHCMREATGTPPNARGERAPSAHRRAAVQRLALARPRRTFRAAAEDEVRAELYSAVNTTLYPTRFSASLRGACSPCLGPIWSGDGMPDAGRRACSRPGGEPVGIVQPVNATVGVMMEIRSPGVPQLWLISAIVGSSAT
jgi:hypothetical protein